MKTWQTSFNAVYYLSLLALLMVFYLQVVRIPPELYAEPFIFFEIYKFNAPAPALAFGFYFILPAFCLVSNFKLTGWDYVTDEKYSKILIVSVVAILAWAFSTYDYNYYYDQAHYLDRFFLIALAVLVFYHPIFIPLFTFELFAILTQFNHPLGRLTWVDKTPLIWTLILAHGILLKPIFKKIDSRVFVVFACALLGSSYFYSGIAKLKISWIAFNSTENLFLGSYLNGWVSFLSEEFIIKVAHVLKKMSLLVVLGTVLTELSGLFILINRKLTLYLFSGFIFMHLMIFVFSGIFFWKWILMNAVFIFIFLRKDSRELFSYRYKFLSVFVIVGFGFVYPVSSMLPPVRLAWHDGSVYQYYDFEIIGESGKKYELPRSFMAPYDVLFSQNRFGYLDEKESVSGTYGAMTKSKILYDDKKARVFDDFISTYFQNLNRKQKKKIWICYFKAPHHIWNFKGNNNYSMDEKVREVHVRMKKAWFDGNKIHVYQNNVIRKIRI